VGYRPDIDGLRALAVLLVAFYHAGLAFGGGFIGVDVFFVISGYLIASLLMDELEAGRFSILDLYERRARRIFPALFALIFVVLIVACFVLIPVDLKRLGTSAAAAVSFVANFRFYFGADYFNQAAHLKPLLHTWSLGIEEQFYILFPFLLLFLWKKFGLRSTFFAISLLTLLSFIACLLVLNIQERAAFYMTPFRAWELFIGVLLALAHRRRWFRGAAKRPILLSALALLGVLAILLPAIAYGPETRFPGWSALLPCLGAALVIGTGGVAKTPVAKVLSQKPLVFLGKLSYSFYLWHWPPLVFVYYTRGHIAPLDGATCLAIGLALAYLSWRFVEQPFRQRKRLSRRHIFAGSMAVTILIASAGSALFLSNGLPQRYPSALTALMDVRRHIHDRRDCHLVTPVRAQAGDVCLRGDPEAEARIVLVGDSHADSLSPAFFAAAAELGLAGYQYTNPGFRPLLGVEMRGSSRWSRQSGTFVDFLADRPEIRTIYVAAWWQHQMTGATYRYRGDVWLDAGYDGSGTAYNKTANLNGLRRLAERFPDRQFVLLDDAPAGKALDINTQVRQWQGGELSAPGLPRALGDAQRATYEAELARLAAEVENIDFFTIFDRFCGEAFCPLFDGGEMLYRDGDHLSLKGALRVTHRMVTVFCDSLNLDDPLACR